MHYSDLYLISRLIQLRFQMLSFITIFSVANIGLAIRKMKQYRCLKLSCLQISVSLLKA